MHFYLDYTVCENVTPFRNDHTIEADWAKNMMAPAATCVVDCSVIQFNSIIPIYAIAFLDLR